MAVRKKWEEKVALAKIVVCALLKNRNKYWRLKKKKRVNKK